MYKCEQSNNFVLFNFSELSFESSSHLVSTDTISRPAADGCEDDSDYIQSPVSFFNKTQGLHVYTYSVIQMKVCINQYLYFN